MNVVLDSDVVIEALRARDTTVLSKWNVLKNSDFAILFSPVTTAEVWAGARPNEHQRISEFFGPLICVPVDQIVGHLAGELLRQYSKSHGLDIADALIAATAIQNQAALWTNNRKHYPMKNMTFYT